MTNEEIIIKEHFKVDDSHSKVRGFVFAYDEDNNLVFAKENMIVKSGRSFIMNNKIENGCFSAAFLSNDKNMVTADDTIPGEILTASKDNTIGNLTKDNFEDWKASENELDQNTNYFSYFIDSEVELVIKCMIIFNDNNAFEASSLGLITKDGKLFSRLTFPTYYKSNHQRLTFKYYIYF